MIRGDLLSGIASNIRGRRKKTGLTINQLAELAGIDGGFLAYIEIGKKMPSLLTVAKIAEALNVPLADLFRGVTGKGSDADYEAHQQLRLLFSGRTSAQRADLLAILKRLRSPKKIKALRQIIG